ncbi:MAG: DNA repair protein RecN [Armatimonadetes bacterium]|nr:DNA repair protein RecN [Armatimonadota bacterium]
MLTELAVSNFALVESVRLPFGSGLAILTGETGAGKSILLDALGMALGGRVGAESIRHGADKARVEAVFSVDNTDSRLADLLESAGIEIEDGVLILAREVSAAGKSSVRINGRAATLSMLRNIGDALVDIHGQHEHQSLLAVERHGDILDAWCGADVAKQKGVVAALHAKATAAAKELETLRADARERVRSLDLLGYQCEEIDTAAPRIEEEDELDSERTRLSSAERLFAAAGSAVDALRGGEGRGAGAGAVDLLAKAVREIESAATFDETLAPLLETLQGALYAADDAARDVRAYRDGVEFNPQRLEEIEARLDILKTLKRKYGETLEEVLAYRAEIGERLETLTNAEERIAELVASEIAARGELTKECAKLTKIRQKGAKPFADAILRELKDLAMAATRFSVSVEPKEPTRTGADAVEFLISPNPGVPLKPLAKIASGGEISRVMLAMKGVLSRVLSVPTLVFDEVDAGIGGRTGTVLGEKLANLSHTAQVLCITHLPQVAARGARHFQIEKRAEKGETIVSVRELVGDDRVKEIARMLGGEETDTVLTHAREMLAAK